MTKQDIQARYLSGEIDRKQMEELLRRMTEISMSNKFEEEQRFKNQTTQRNYMNLQAKENDKNRAAAGKTSTLSSANLYSSYAKKS